MPKIDRLAIYERDGGLCAFCGQPVPWDVVQLDHIRPRALGGSTISENLRPSHRACNIVGGNEVRLERRRLGLPPAEPGQVLIRDVPPDLWYEVRRVAASQSGPENRVTMRDIVIEALKEWLAQQPKKGAGTIA